MEKCLFCSIANGSRKTELRYQDDVVAAFDDISPKARIHVLIVPKKHIDSVATLTGGDEAIVGHMVKTAQSLAEKLGIANDGYRLVFNTRSHGGQVIDHIHLHLLGGQRLGSMV